MTTLTEADTCRKYVLPKLYAASWTDEQISEQKSFTDGRIVVAGAKPTRRPQKRADYLLKYRRDFTLAVVEAKSVYKHPGDGLQQAKDYARILGLKFAYSTNGHGIVEHDFFTGKDNDLETFPTPDELWHRLQAAENITPEISERVLAPYNHLSEKHGHPPFYASLMGVHIFYLMRTFVRLRELQATYKDLADKLEELQEKYDDYRTRTTQSNSTQVSNACEENHCAGQTRSRRTRSPQSA
jgi:hypothetical protein